MNQRLTKISDENMPRVLHSKKPEDAPSIGKISHSFSRRRFLGVAAALICTGGIFPGCMPGRKRESERLDRENLLIYRNEEGQIRPVREIREWLIRRAEIVDGMQRIMGPLPEAEKRGAPLDMQTVWEREENGILIRHITYHGDPGEPIPAYLLLPAGVGENDNELPAVLSPLGTNQTEVTFSRQSIEEQSFPLWEDHRDWPRELAARGYAVLIPPYPHLGEYRPDLSGMEYVSGTMKAVWNNIRGVDLLEELPYVAAEAVGAIGHSLGGHNSIYTAVFDERLQVIVSSCGFDSYLDYMDGDIAGWAQERYMPRIGEVPLEEIPFDFHEMIAALAPRRFYSNSPRGDDNFKWESAAEAVETASQIYELYEAPDRLIIDHPDAGHVFPQQQRERAYALFDRYIAGRD